MEGPHNDLHSPRDPRDSPLQRSGSLRHPTLSTLLESEEVEEPLPSQPHQGYFSATGYQYEQSADPDSIEAEAAPETSVTEDNHVYDHLRRFSFESATDTQLDGQSLDRFNHNADDRLDLVE